MVGNIALVSHPGTGKNPSRFWFKDWNISGSKIEEHIDRTLGPILCTQYTVHDGVLKLTAQLAPVGPQDGRTATLQIKRGADWQTVGTAEVVIPGYTATFRVEKWDAA
jgi:hypothetical protein